MVETVTANIGECQSEEGCEDTHFQVEIVFEMQVVDERECLVLVLHNVLGSCTFEWDEVKGKMILEVVNCYFAKLEGVKGR